jgi:hypothetical protein
MGALTDKWLGEVSLTWERDLIVQEGATIYTEENAADAIYDMVCRQIVSAVERQQLDGNEVLHAVWRKITLDSVRARRSRLDILTDVARVLKVARS